MHPALAPVAALLLVGFVVAFVASVPGVAEFRRRPDARPWQVAVLVVFQVALVVGIGGFAALLLRALGW